MTATIQLIGRSILDGSIYPQIRFRAAKLASRAKPKDYFGQAREIFDDFVKRWRYVRDPLGMEMLARSPTQIYEMVMGGDSGIGVGDCDDATIAIGSQLRSIGFPVRIATIAPVGAPPGKLMSHVFAQTHIPGHGWITVDPVVYPDHGFGYLPNHSRLAIWDLDGKLVKKLGNFRGISDFPKGGIEMLGSINRMEDYAGLGDYSEEMNPKYLPDFRQVAADEYGIDNFGAYSESLGIMGGFGLIAEVDDENGLAWTPALEIAPHDYAHMRSYGRPYNGMLALGDNGVAYEYDQNLGFFKKLFRRVKSKVRKVARKVLSKIPGGKYLLKLGEKVFKIAKKLVGPLAKFVGKYATKLAPVAALIPGYGPAIAGALYTAGKVANLMNKYGVKITGEKGKVRKLKFQSGKSAKQFRKHLEREAKKQKRQSSKRGLRGYDFL